MMASVPTNWKGEVEKQIICSLYRLNDEQIARIANHGQAHGMANVTDEP